LDVIGLVSRRREQGRSVLVCRIEGTKAGQVRQLHFHSGYPRLDLADIRARLKTSLADYKVPRHIEMRTGLPREDSGKFFKRRLRDPYWEQAGRRI